MNTVTTPVYVELIGYTQKGVILDFGDDRGITVGRVIDPLELLQSALYESLGPRDRQLVFLFASSQSERR
jgi:hypothetical protein